MTKPCFIQRLTAAALIAVFAVQLTSCGTLLHPDRRGQSSGRIDPGIAVMDGVGLLLFVIPGLIAYAIDFSTGAIYLPGGSSASTSNGVLNGDGLTVVQTGPGGLSRAELQALLEMHTGYPVNLDSAEIEILPLEEVEDILPTYARFVESGEVHDTELALAH